MADKPSLDSNDVTKGTLPASRPKQTGNPVFRMMGNLNSIYPSKSFVLINFRITQLPLQTPISKLAHLSFRNRLVYYRHSLRSLPQKESSATMV